MIQKLALGTKKMTEEEARAIYQSARSKTSAKAAELLFAFRKEDGWFFLIQHREDEYAISIPPEFEDSSKAFEEAIVFRLRKLF